MSTIVAALDCPAELQVAVEMELTAGRQWVLLNRTDRCRQHVRFRAPDLRVAQRVHRQIRSRIDPQSPAATTPVTMVDVHVAIRADGTYAAAELASHRTRASAPAAPGLLFVGTPHQLTGLVADIHSAGVADGVTLVLGDPVHDLAAIRAVTLPELAERKHFSYVDGVVCRALTAADTMDKEPTT